MANLSLKHVYKVYPNGTKAVNDFTMEIADKEFIVFVGPSGCGKSTTLRMIAGLEDITAGEVSIGDAVVNDMEPKDRNIAMVFQNYALYPHMTVYENMAFGLKLRKLPNEEIHRRVVEAAVILGITEYLDRKPRAMSGGQRQRVALGRAIVREPKVFLLDEPLSNLDAKLRAQMRSEISKLHHRLNTTFIYVTHDQTEAMTLGTRIVVMKDGYIQQIDTPRNLYNDPANRFVAGFIGTPQMNFFEADLHREGGQVRVALHGTDTVLTLPLTYFLKVRPEYLTGERRVVLGIRAEKVLCDPEYVAAHAEASAVCTVSHTEELGDETLVFGDLADNAETVAEAMTNLVFKVDSERGSEIHTGDKVPVAFEYTALHFFDSETEQSVCPRLPEVNVFDGQITDGKLLFDGMEFVLPPALALSDGAAEVEIPSDAFVFDGTAAVTCEHQEMIGAKRLLHLVSGGRTFFAVSEEAVGETVSVGFDPKRITLLRDGKPVREPLEAVNKLYGSLTRRTVRRLVSENGKDRVRKSVEFDLNIGGTVYSTPDAMLKKLITGGGVKVFKKKLRFEFDPYAVRLCDKMRVGTVAETVDYGAERFALVEVGGSRIAVRLASEEKPQAGEAVALDFDLGAITVIDDAIDIIIA